MMTIEKTTKKRLVATNERKHFFRFLDNNNKSTNFINSAWFFNISNMNMSIYNRNKSIYISEKVYASDYWERKNDFSVVTQYFYVTTTLQWISNVAALSTRAVPSKSKDVLSNLKPRTSFMEPCNNITFTIKDKIEWSPRIQYRWGFQELPTKI